MVEGDGDGKRRFLFLPNVRVMKPRLGVMNASFQYPALIPIMGYVL